MRKISAKAVFMLTAFALCVFVVALFVHVLPDLP